VEAGIKNGLGWISLSRQWLKPAKSADNLPRRFGPLGFRHQYRRGVWMVPNRTINPYFKKEELREIF